MKIKPILLSIFLVFAFVSACYAPIVDKDNLSLKETISLLQKALLNVEMPYLEKHVAFESIVGAKVQKFSKGANAMPSFWARSMGKLTNVGQPVISKVACHYILKEYNKSPRSLREAYLQNVQIKNIKENGDKGSASGSFLGKPAALSAMKKDGKWIVTGVESPIIDEEIQYMLDSFKQKK